MRERATQVKADGVAFSDIWRTLGLPGNTVAHWLYGAEARRYRERPPDPPRCPRCRPMLGRPDDVVNDTYLLGLYLGDGHLVMTARVPVLRMFCADAWPGLRPVRARDAGSPGEIRAARAEAGMCRRPGLFEALAVPIAATRPRKEARPAYSIGRPAAADHRQNPGPFLRGLFHSDGCRVTNRIVKGGKTYTYPRYMFSNESADVMCLCKKSLDRLGISWKMCRRNSLSVARMEAVAALDQHAGPTW